MSIPVALIVSACIAAAAILGTGYINPYEISTVSSDGTAVAWRLDKRTGVISLCAVFKRPIVVHPHPSGPDPFADMNLPAVKALPTDPMANVYVECSDDHRQIKRGTNASP